MFTSATPIHTSHPNQHDTITACSLFPAVVAVAFAVWRTAIHGVRIGDGVEHDDGNDLPDCGVFVFER